MNSAAPFNAEIAASRPLSCLNVVRAFGPHTDHDQWGPWRRWGKIPGALREARRRSLALAGGTLSVDWVFKSVTDTSEKLRANWDIENLAGMLDDVAILDETLITARVIASTVPWTLTIFSVDCGSISLEATMRAPDASRMDFILFLFLPMTVPMRLWEINGRMQELVGGLGGGSV